MHRTLWGPATYKDSQAIQNRWSTCYEHLLQNSCVRILLDLIGWHQPTGFIAGHII